MQKVLIVEDRRDYQAYYKRALDGKLDIIHAFTIAEAEAQFEANPDIAAIVMDACVPGGSPNTLPLVEKFRTTFSGPMIASSSAWKYRQILLKAGCSHETDKGDVPHILLKLLGI